MKSFYIFLLTITMILTLLNSTVSKAQYKLPWKGGDSHTCTCGNNQCEHTGSAQYAFDFSMSIGTKIYAMRSGTVIQVVNCNANGNCVYNNGCSSSCINNGNRIIIQGSDGYEDLYLHLDQYGTYVSVGQCVVQGQIIGRSGNSGCSSNPHLHVQRMSSCAASGTGCPSLSPYYCTTHSLTFSDVSSNGGIPQGGSSYPSGNSSCGTPTFLTVTPYVTTAYLSWTSVTSASSYQIKYKQTSGNTYYYAYPTSSSYTLSNLTPNTSYQVQIRTSCSGNYSNYNCVRYFSTYLKLSDSLQEPTTNDIQVYPNPIASGGYLFVSGLLGKSTIEMLDATGKVIGKFEGDDEVKIEVPNGHSGLILLIIRNMEGVVRFKKIIVK